MNLPDRKSAERIAQELVELYVALDAGVARELGGRGASCAKGCAGCCHQLTAIGLNEALVLALAIYQRHDWRDIVRRLVATASRCPPGTTREAWFRRGTPCPLLTPTSSCSVYAARPSPCRFHFVRSPPANCFPGATDSITEQFDAREAQNYVIRASVALHKHNPQLGPAWAAPIPLVTLWALLGIAEGGDRRWLAGWVEGLPTPSAWWEAA